jgi:class 3 adenylate cyclase
VRAALAVVELVRALGRDAPELEPVARAGIATGEALVGRGRAPVDGDALVQGDVVGAALRLLGGAAADSVIAGGIRVRAHSRSSPRSSGPSS